MRSSFTAVRYPKESGSGVEPAAGTLSAALEDVADAARKVVADQLELVRLELRDVAARWLRALVLMRVVLPLAGIGWLAAMAGLGTAVARLFDWPLALGGVAVLNLGAAGLAAAVAGRFVRRPERPR